MICLIPIRAYTADIGLFSQAVPGAELPAGWQPLVLGSVDRLTRYTVVEADGTVVVRADSDNAASALVYPITVDLTETPVLQWRWKVDNILENGNALSKNGDDYPARLYVLFDVGKDDLSFFESLKLETYRFFYGQYPPLAAINYLWANRQPVGELIPNSYSERVQMYVVQSGKQKLGKWLQQERNIYADYVRAFGEPVPKVSGIAIMTDTDNTAERATAYYGDIRLLPAP
jgi:hypothetical protein